MEVTKNDTAKLDRIKFRVSILKQFTIYDELKSRGIILITSMKIEQNNMKKPPVPSLRESLNLPIIESAGGLVSNSNHHILLMFKRGKWDMPKGRIEDGNDREESALREVQEETGLNSKKLVIQSKLISTWHTTSHQSIKYLKKTHWYLMEYDGKDDDTSPQVEEGIIECRWVHLSDLPEYRELLRARINYVIDFWHQNLAYVPRS